MFDLVAQSLQGNQCAQKKKGRQNRVTYLNSNKCPQLLNECQRLPLLYLIPLQGSTFHVSRASTTVNLEQLVWVCQCMQIIFTIMLWTSNSGPYQALAYPLAHSHFQHEHLWLPITRTTLTAMPLPRRLPPAYFPRRKTPTCSVTEWLSGIGYGSEELQYVHQHIGRSSSALWVTPHLGRKDGHHALIYRLLHAHEGLHGGLGLHNHGLRCCCCSCRLWSRCCCHSTCAAPDHELKVANLLHACGSAWAQDTAA